MPDSSLGTLPVDAFVLTMPAMSRPVTLSIVIVNWNSGALLSQCLASIVQSAAALGPEFALQSVVVVDNGSTDGSERLRPDLVPVLAVIRNEQNRGFAAACNQGAAGLVSDVILFLNPDTRLFADSLVAPLQLLQQPAHSRTGIVGIAMVDDSGQVVPSCARYPRAWHFASHAIGLDRLWPRSGHYMLEWNHADTRQVDQVIGAFFMIRRSVFDAMSGFDERFFVYFEEVDLAWRARQAGWASVYLAEASAYHRGGGTTDAVKDVRLFYSLRSRLLYGRKHYAWPERLLLWVTTFALEPLTRVLHLGLAGRWAEIRQVAAANAMLWRDLLARPPDNASTLAPRSGPTVGDEHRGSD
jgi:N-acetylglucosaminyl-diphospho-decaprenol L-rhamnosyltransferase